MRVFGEFRRRWDTRRTTDLLLSRSATQDGRAAEQFGNTAEVLFRGRNVGNTGIHDEFVAKFDEGRNLGKEAKYAEAITVLTQTFEYPLTLYEQAKAHPLPAA